MDAGRIWMPGGFITNSDDGERETEIRKAIRDVKSIGGGGSMGGQIGVMLDHLFYGFDTAVYTFFLDVSERGDHWIG